MDKKFLDTIRSKSIKDLTQLLNSKKKELVSITMDLHFGRTTKHAQLRQIKKEVARIETVINEIVMTEANKPAKERL
jgi:ribosomal protein L29